MSLVKNLTLSDIIYDLGTRKIKTVFFNQINTLLDWDKISRIIINHYTKGIVQLESLAMMDFYYSKCVYFKSCTETPN